MKIFMLSMLVLLTACAETESQAERDARLRALEAEQSAHQPRDEADKAARAGLPNR
jgi:hypothetical protein